MIETRLLPVPDALSGSLDYVRFARVPKSPEGTPGSPAMPSMRASIILALGEAPGYVRPDGSRYIAPRAAVSFGWDRAASLFPASGGDFVVLRLSPAGLPGGLGVRGADIIDAPVALEDLTGGSSSLLLEALSDAETDAQRLDALVRVLAPELGRRKQPEILEYILKRMRETTGRITLAELKAETGVSRQKLHARIRRCLGMDFRTAKRLLRLDLASDRLNGGSPANWSRFAMECGYSDQAHMLRDFRELAGRTPAVRMKRYARWARA